MFPGADYSRLSHCIGVCHVTGRILESLAPQCALQADDPEYQLYRLAGLLHDIGHYPFSHAFEDAVTAFYKDRSQAELVEDHSSLVGTQLASHSGADYPQMFTSLNHEEVGRTLLDEDQEIRQVLERYSIEPASIYSIFSRDSSVDEGLPRFANLISSDLDADRIDYLLRTALHTGLPYGQVDADYLLSQMTLDPENRICLTPKAIRTVEHFLIGRYFDYQQVSFHKTVASLEWVLNDVVKVLLDAGLFDCSEQGVRNLISTGKWYDFDDLEIMGMIRNLPSNQLSESDNLKVQTIIRRIPPKLIGSIEFLGDRDSHEHYQSNHRILTRLCDDLANEFSIDRQLWHVWGNRPMAFTKVGAYSPISTTAADPDAFDQSVFIFDGKETKPISQLPWSLISVLAQRVLYSTRLYVLLPENQQQQRRDILDRVRREISSVFENWVDG